MTRKVLKIKDLIVKTEKVDWQSLKDLQPINLKNNYHAEKVKKSLINNGFASSIYVWQDKDDIYIIDGHCRNDVLRDLKNDGYEIPDKLNCTFLDLPNKKTAVKYLLQVFNQKTNPVNQGSLDIWLEELDIDLPDLEIKLDDLHIDLIENIEEIEEEMPELKDGDKEPFQQITFTLSDDQANFIQEKLSDIKKTDAFKYIETFGNQNSNGNSLYTIFQEWERQNK